MNNQTPFEPGCEPGAENDRLLRQVRSVLTPMPEVDRRAIAGILNAVAHRKRTPWQRFVSRFDGVREWWQFSVPPLARGASLAAGALMLGFVARPYLTGNTNGVGSVPTVAVQADGQRAESLGAASPMRTTLQAVEGGDVSVFRIPTQFVLDARDIPNASSVSIVGDFNDWDVTTTPLVLERGVWTITVPLSPGRHMYSFVVNGETWMADPRAAQATDADFGRPGSVIIVQSP
ncbi:MAG: isoamylase early set domain-containing protein [Gemmatimonadaceae bacterium]|nr:isoamylase early set domain-containing protein [Gemmatimonadaceae bacterium]